MTEKEEIYKIRKLPAITLEQNLTFTKLIYNLSDKEINRLLNLYNSSVGISPSINSGFV